MEETILKNLYETFDLKERKGQGGMVFRYVPNEDVINRMNKVFQGNWSTKVIDKDVVDDQVIIEVQVNIYDEASECEYTHTGFGSQQIMRYSSGPNAGKIIDIGNAYKGALAKGIVNACTRWGVGLFKERNPYEMDNVTMVADDTPAPKSVPVMSPAVPPAAAAPVPPKAVHVAPPTTGGGTTNIVPPSTSAMPPAAVPPPSTAAAPVPPINTSATPPPSVFESKTTAPAMPMPGSTVSTTLKIEQEKPAQPLPNFTPPNTTPAPERPTLPMSNGGGNLDAVGISDVQRVALNGILSMNNAKYDELAREAFDSKGMSQAVPPKEQLSYEEAVVVIKYGNDKFRKNR